MRKITFISSFFIKIIAIFAMTLDHIGTFLELAYYSNSVILQICSIFRIIGRIALPLFAFMIVEGVLHTKSIKRYLLRLGILASIMSTVFIIIEYTSVGNGYIGLARAGNIYLDLILIAIAVYCLKHPKWYIKLITLLPLLFATLSFIVKGIEITESIDIHWFPCFLTLQYDWLSVLLGIGFYVSYLLADYYIKSTNSYDKSIWEETGNYRILVNIIMVFIATIIHLFYYAFYYIWPSMWTYGYASRSLFAIISGAFILFYSGKRGYNAKWFRIGTYLYYPLHIAILVIVFAIINGGV